MPSLLQWQCGLIREVKSINDGKNMNVHVTSHIYDLSAFCSKFIKKYVIEMNDRVTIVFLSLNLHKHRGSAPVFSGVRFPLLFSFLCCAFCFACFCSVSCVLNVTRVTGFSLFLFTELCTFISCFHSSISYHTVNWLLPYHCDKIKLTN